MTAPSSRLTRARRRLRIARYAIVAVAAAGFGGGIAVARASHPATHSTAGATQAVQQSTFSFGTSAIAPAASAPVIQSAGS